ncbi:ComF family protein [Liquorilactobacillus oeni]|uniref:Amidophosphoribosyltransferase n=1 Tax=Liquorilactobacillus oeni DSM 19972 TaxID=1423777 RepID=A0A0R1M930_9LACO|nr:phosphoribosyltransferase family protein [Liquorilactobacillus oeni]KRL04845.1 amidophosphoribosyltransferase [Liquorilactobacillus oeni DSM 19972]
MKEYFERFKFSGDYYLRLVFQKELEAKLKENYHKGWLFVPIPVSKEVFEKRGFNQVEGLFENICLSKMLSVKKISKKQQSLLKRRERMQAAQPFELTTGFEKEIKGKNILLLDDIYTTGRTLYHAQALLKKAGAKKVHSVTLAR